MRTGRSVECPRGPGWPASPHRRRRARAHPRAPAAHLRVGRAAPVRGRAGRRGAAGDGRGGARRRARLPRDGHPVRGPRRRLGALRRRPPGRGGRADRPHPPAADPRGGPRQPARHGRAGRHQRRRVAAPSGRPTSSRPTRRPRSCARSAATWRRTRAARTASSTASPPTTSPGSRWCCRTARWCSSAARSSTAPATTSSARSWAPRGRSAWPRASSCALCRSRSRCARSSPSSTPPRRPARWCPRSSRAGSCPGAIEMMDNLSIQAAEPAVGAGYPLDAGAALVVEIDGAAAECSARFDEVIADLRGRGRHRRAGGRGRGRAGADLAHAQGRLRRDGPHLPQLLRAGQRDPPHPPAAGARPDRGAVGRVRAARGQRLPRGRRQPPSARLLRRQGGRRARARGGAGRA